MRNWTVAREWAGETVFVLAGGPSVADLDLSPLAGRRVIAINSAHLSWPMADIVFYADARWWTDLGSKESVRAARIVTTGAAGPASGLHLVKVEPSPGIALDPCRVALRRTSVSGAINLAVHLGAARVVLLGVDGGLVNGRRHHHGVKYPWPLVDRCFDEHRVELEALAPSVAAVGVEVLNCSPVSALRCWERIAFPEALEMIDRKSESRANVVPDIPVCGDPIRIFVGTAANGEDAESCAVLEWSIRKSTSRPVTIEWMRLSRDDKSFWHGFNSERWATPFSGLRWAIPAFCGFEGRAIYMDSDVIVTGDVAELWEQDLAGKAVLAKNAGRLCVSLWDCARAKDFVLPLGDLKRNPEAHRIMGSRARTGGMVGGFAGHWNCLDGEGFGDLDDPSLKAIHYTDMSCQPHLARASARLAARGERHWFDGQIRAHPRRDLQHLFDRLLEEAEANGFAVGNYVPATPFGAYRKQSLAAYGGRVHAAQI